MPAHFLLCPKKIALKRNKNKNLATLKIHFPHKNFKTWFQAWAGVAPKCSVEN